MCTFRASTQLDRQAQPIDKSDLPNVRVFDNERMTHYDWPVRDPRQITIDRGDVGRRLDLVLQRHLREVTSASRTRIQQWIEDGLVSVNDTPARRPSRRTSSGDSISILVPPQAERAVMQAEAMPLDVLYEDEHLLAVNKAAGMVVHPTHRHPNGTLMNALLWHAHGWPDGARPSLVGRLDRFTSGVLIVAKSRAVHALLQRTLASPRSEKRYLAVVYGHVNLARGTIDAGLSRSRREKRTVVSVMPSAARSQTVFERLRRVAAPRVGLALLGCRLMTGRTHQIRAHLADRGWPIVGDAKYGRPLWAAIENDALSAVLRNFPRQALHAWRLMFEHPITGVRVTCEARPPEDFQQLLNVANLR
jgi:23S rRNA pseudouridine1911/1915/1917 synthase